MWKRQELMVEPAEHCGQRQKHRAEFESENMALALPRPLATAGIFPPDAKVES